MKKKYLIFILILFIALLPLEITLSKYIINSINDYIMEANNFFFNSDKLRANGANYQVNNWSGVGTFNIQFNLNNMKNNILSSTSDIEYDLTVTCDDDVICSLNSDNGIILSAEKIDDFILTITPQRVYNDNESVSIYVEANSQSPYKKKLSATFVITVGKRGISYEINDEANRAYLNFTITNALTSYTITESFGNYVRGQEIDSEIYLSLSAIEKSKCTSALVTLSFDPSDVIVDTTSSLIESAIKGSVNINNVSYINSVTFKVDALSSNVIRFYKKNINEDYTFPFVALTPIVRFSIDSSFSGAYDGKDFTVTLNPNGGVVNPLTKTVYYNHVVGSLPTPVRSGYTFDGWYTVGGNKIEANSIYLENSGMELIAHWVINYHFDYTGDVQTFNVLYTGRYKLEAWGGQGGYAYSTDYDGGYGGYSSGIINLTQGTTLYVYVGGKGTDGDHIEPIIFYGGYNGGGNGKGNSDKYISGGGGASHIAKITGLLSTLNNQKNNILIVASGGGGSAYQSDIKYGTGGNGGGISGVAGIKYDEDNKTWKIGTGGTQTNGGSGYSSGSFGKGATYSGNNSPGGGAGFYGGGSGQYYAGAGGGSGYIGNTNLSEKVMYCYNCAESIDETSFTVSTNNVSLDPITNFAKKGNGYIEITYYVE